jgi:hypothetical protein
MVHREDESAPREGVAQVKMKGIAAAVLVLVLMGLSGCGHVQTSSTPNAVTVQDFGCGGDIPSPYPPYCRPVPP